MNRAVTHLALFGVLIVLAGGVWAFAQDKAVQPKQEYEKKVKESEVPPAALAALKKLAGGAALIEFAEEVEHGHKYYEGTWKGPHGKIDGLVTETGDVVEIEETMPIEQVPGAVREALQKEAGKDARITVERKTLYIYEGHFKKDGRGRELQFTAEGRAYYEQGRPAGREEEDEDEDE